MEQVKFAILERDGGMTVIPRERTCRLVKPERFPARSRPEHHFDTAILFVAESLVKLGPIRQWRLMGNDE